MNDSSIQIIVFTGIIFFGCLAGFIIYFIILYQKKQIQNKLQQENLQSTFQKELLKTQIEVQEQTLANISREIHDNISQVLSFIKLNLGTIDEANDITRKRIEESRELLAQSINDLRNLSKSLSFEHISQLGLEKTMSIETERINNSGLITAGLKIVGEVYVLGADRELVLFRIFQEALNNTLKHAGAKYLKISLQYSQLLFILTLEDDGEGFSPQAPNNSGAGLKNMRNRAALIGADIDIDSSPGNGCFIKVTLNPFKPEFYADGNHQNSIS